MTKNITLSIDEDLLEAGRKYAQEHDMSFNALVRDLVSRTVKPGSSAWVTELFDKVEKAQGNSGGYKWCREDAYDV